MIETPIHLDTSFLIRALQPDSAEDHKLREFLRGGRSLSISTIAWAEFLCGPLTDQQHEIARRLTSKRISFTEEDAAIAADLFNDSGRRRATLADCMIAATALRCEAELATANRADFERLGVSTPDAGEESASS